MEPTSERIVDDISNFLVALHRGRLARSADETKNLKHNPRLCQRKNIMLARPIY